MELKLINLKREYQLQDNVWDESVYYGTLRADGELDENKILLNPKTIEEDLKDALIGLGYKASEIKSIKVSYDFDMGEIDANIKIIGQRLSVTLISGLNRKLEPSKGIEEAKAKYDKLKRDVEFVEQYKENKNQFLLKVSVDTYNRIEKIVDNENGEYEDLMAEYESLKEILGAEE